MRSEHATELPAPNESLLSKSQRSSNLAEPVRVLLCCSYLIFNKNTSMQLESTAQLRNIPTRHLWNLTAFSSFCFPMTLNLVVKERFMGRRGTTKAYFLIASSISHCSLWDGKTDFQRQNGNSCVCCQEATVEYLRIVFWNFKWHLWSDSLGIRCPWSYIEVTGNNFKWNNCFWITEPQLQVSSSNLNLSPL